LRFLLVRVNAIFEGESEMSTEKTLVPTSLTETTSGNQQLDPSQPKFPVPTYQGLIEFHLKRVELDEKGNRRPQQSLDNARSVISNWVAVLGLDPLGPVGEELGIRFSESQAVYLLALENKGLSKRTISDRKSITGKLRESFLEFKLSNGMPQDFPGALRYLVESTGISLRRLSVKSGIDKTTISSWMSGTQNPASNSLTHIRKLEKVFQIPEGTLSSTLPDAIWVKAPDSGCTTDWRCRQRELVNLKYRLSHFPDRLQVEWDELELFYTNDQWVYEHRLKRNSEWRIRWNNGRCITGEIHFNSLRSFFGYLCLPTTNYDKRVVGLGFSPEKLSLALLSDADLVLKYLYFMKSRAGSFNHGTIHFLSFCSALLRNETGYLRNRPEFGALLIEPVSTGNWQAWCEANRNKLREFRNRIQKSKKDGVRMTHNPFEPVMDYIKGRQHPLSALFDLSATLESLTPLLKSGSGERLAVHCRSIFHVNLISSNPLRIENFSMMTYIPRDYASYERASEKFRLCSENKQQPNFAEMYVETTPESNLYQRRDGSWRLRFNERDFKNDKGEDLEKGVQSASYDVPVSPSVWPSLAEYIFIHRAVLNKSLRDKLKLIRAARGLPFLTPEEELSILRCPYVFRPASSGIQKVRGDQSQMRYAVGQIRPRILSDKIFALTGRYLPDRKGFSANACRHLVATEYIKNHPNGYEEAAAALHNTAAMVRKHYAWVEVGDLIKPWSNYYDDLKKKYDEGEI
jgi:transcriptional regulator with XRE-family HTH domain